jgi:hypothetical protein
MKKVKNYGILYFILFTAIMAIIGLISPSWVQNILFSSLLSIDAILIVIYLVAPTRYNSQISIILSGQQSGNPIPVLSREGTIWLGITSDQDKDISLEEIRVEYNDGLVDISIDEELVTKSAYARTEEGTAKVTVREYGGDDSKENRKYGQIVKEPTLDLAYPDSIVISSLPIVKRDFIHVYGVKYESGSDDFSFVVKVVSGVKDYEVVPPWNMFSFGSQKYSQLINLKVDSTEVEKSQRLLRYGFQLPSGKTMIVAKVE